jgi:hypothetical protein
MRNWAVPKYQYSQRVKIVPLENVEARVIDLHQIGMTGDVEYDVRYFQDGKEVKCRVFEDEIINGD